MVVEVMGEKPGRKTDGMPRDTVEPRYIVGEFRGWSSLRGERGGI